LLHLASADHQNKRVKTLPRALNLNITLHFEVFVTGSLKISRPVQNAMLHLEPSEVLSVLRAAKAKGPREWAMIVVAYKHGMRASEVCNLRLADLDMKNGSLVVERLKGSLRTTQAVTEHRGEPLLNELKALREWLRARPHDGSDFLFTSQKGGQLDRSQFFRLFRAIARDAGLRAEKQHPHVLKHSLATHLIAANINLALVKQQLGHKSIGSTMRYAAVRDEQASKATAAALMELY
jgi:type 1 fimbriae regulatory protein FimB